jgi:hypothetical protein
MSDIDDEIAEKLTEAQAEDVLALLKRTEAIRILLERNAHPNPNAVNSRNTAQECILKAIDDINYWAIRAIGA